MASKTKNISSLLKGESSNRKQNQQLFTDNSSLAGKAGRRLWSHAKATNPEMSGIFDMADAIGGHFKSRSKPTSMFTANMGSGVSRGSDELGSGKSIQLLTSILSEMRTLTDITSKVWDVNKESLAAARQLNDIQTTDEKRRRFEAQEAGERRSEEPRAATHMFKQDAKDKKEGFLAKAATYYGAYATGKGFLQTRHLKKYMAMNEKVDKLSAAEAEAHNDLTATASNSNQSKEDIELILKKRDIHAKAKADFETARNNPNRNRLKNKITDKNLAKAANAQSESRAALKPYYEQRESVQSELNKEITHMATMGIGKNNHGKDWSDEEHTKHAADMSASNNKIKELSNKLHTLKEGAAPLHEQRDTLKQLGHQYIGEHGGFVASAERAAFHT